MANYQNLISAVDAVIKTNNRREITGQILQNVLNQMIGSLGENMQLSGFATPATDPHSPDQNVFYFATQAGTYTHFNNIVLDDGFSVLMWKNGQWTADTLDITTRTWVQNNFVSIEWFRKVFRAYTSNNAEVQPNDMTTVIDNIKAMFGLWTDEYLSALGIGQGGGGGGASYLADLLDVDLTSPQNGQALVYNSTLAKWVNGTAGVDMSTVWSNLAASGNEQINASHLSTVLSDYVTNTSLSSTLASYATQTWVSQNYISIAYFDRLFRAYNGSTLVNHNDTTTIIDNVKSMFGFWTEFYLSALGNGGQAGSAIYLSQLADVVLSSPTNGQALVYDATNSQWVNGTITSGVSALANLSDVLISAPSAGQALTYDAVSAKWQNTSLATSLLSDILLSSIQSNQVLIWDATSAKWVNSSLKTINGVPIYGSGDISVGGGASGNYLPIAGGTMSGDYPITFTPNRIALEFREYPSNTYSSRVEYMTRGNEALVFSNGNPVTSYIFKCGQFITNTSDWTDITPSMQIKNQSVYINSLIANGDSPSYNLYVAGTGCFTESLKAADLKFEYHNEINSYDDSNQNLYLNYRSSGYVSICKGGGNVVIGDSRDYGYQLYVNGRIAGNALCLPNGGRINVQGELSNSSFFIGNSGNQGWVRMQDVCGASGTPGEASGWSIRISGNALFANVQSNGYVTALSDIRHKTIIKDTDIQVDEIAKMPAVVYRWDDGREDDSLHVGSIAQNWQSVLPEVVLRANDKEGTLSLQYGVAALVSSIVTARKVVEHEERIAELERENKELKSKLNIA